MLGILSVWLGLASLVMSLVMVLYRPAFHDVLLLIEIYFACPLSLMFGGLVLWATRQEKSQNAAPRLQAKVGITLALVAAAMVYCLVAFADRLVPA